MTTDYDPEAMVEDDSQSSALQQEAIKARRHLIEQELNALPFDKRVEHVLRILAVRGGPRASDTAVLCVVLHPLHKGDEVRFSVATGEIGKTAAPGAAPPPAKTFRAAFTRYAVDMILGLEGSIEVMRAQADLIEQRVGAVRAAAARAAAAIPKKETP